MIPMGDLTLKILCKLGQKTGQIVKFGTTCEAGRVFIISEERKQLHTPTFDLEEIEKF